jgi:dTDP-4-dehydrorhamnose reductase
MKLKKKIYIAGAGGMLGDSFYRVFKEDYEIKCTDIDTNESWLSYMDFRDYNSYLNDVLNFKPDYIFHLGAFTDLEYCELNISDTYITNTLAVENAVIIGNLLDIPILYISTAGIFDGTKDIFDDWDIPNPMGHYARSKFAGETYVINNSRRYLICRAGWMMGSGPNKDKKFINKLMLQIKNGARELLIVNDKLGTPTYTVDFAHNVKLLIEKEYWGLYNMVCGGFTGRLEVAQELLKIIGYESKISIKEVDSSYWSKTYFALRPPSERLVNTKLDLRGLNIMRDWRVCLVEYINDYYNNYLD